MPVAYLNGSVATLYNTVSVTANQSYPYDSLSTGADRILVVTTIAENGIGVPTGVTYGGVALTKAITVSPNSGDGFSETGDIWTLTNPAAGSNTLAFSGGGSGQDGAATASVYTGVDQATPIGNTAVNSALEGTEATTVSITKQSEDNLIVWTYVYDQGDKAMAAIADNMGLVLAYTDFISNRASSFGTGYRSAGTSSVLVGANRTSGGSSEDNGIAAIELMASPSGPVTPINPSITNLLATSARLNWEQG
jgi:hypothetical protein